MKKLTYKLAIIDGNVLTQDKSGGLPNFKVNLNDLGSFIDLDGETDKEVLKKFLINCLAVYEAHRSKGEGEDWSSSFDVKIGKLNKFVDSL